MTRENWDHYTFDPTRTLKDSKIMARNIEAYYHDRGHLWVQCTVTKEYRPIEHFEIKSNLVFNALDADGA